MADSPKRTLGFTFTETMGGFISPDERDYKRAAKAGRRSGTTFRFVVTILADDLKTFVREPAHEARMTGTIDSPMFGGTRAIESGAFNLFIEDESGRKQMRYRMQFADPQGTRYRLEGFKDVHNDYVVDVWKDTTTLFTTIRREDGAGAADPVVATGILTIRAIDLIPQVWSMRALTPRNPLQHVTALARFGWFFTGRVMNEYLGLHGRSKARS